jgi:hypothetical protein
MAAPGSARVTPQRSSSFSSNAAPSGGSLDGIIGGRAFTPIGQAPLTPVDPALAFSGIGGGSGGAIGNNGHSMAGMVSSNTSGVGTPVNTYDCNIHYRCFWRLILFSFLKSACCFQWGS